MSKRKHFGGIVFTLTLITLHACGARSAEIRMLTEMPKSNATTAREVTKSKKAGWYCRYIVQNAETGNNKGAKGKKKWFTDVPKNQDEAAEALLVEGKRAVECTLKARIDGKMRNAETEE